MHKPFSTFGLAACGTLAFCTTAARDDASVKAAIEKIESKMTTAMKAGDLAYLKSVLTDDFIVIEKGKTYNKAQWADATSKTLKSVKILSVTMKIESAKDMGHGAILHTKSTLSGTFTGPSGKAQHLVDNSADEETWVLTKSGWKFKKDMTLSESATLDGKPVNP
jgi:ketosteroid isomerase-like protein